MLVAIYVEKNYDKKMFLFYKPKLKIIYTSEYDTTIQHEYNTKNN